MTATEDLLQRIDAEKRECDQTIGPPATPGAMERVRSDTRNTLRAELSESHVRFLERNHGLKFNSYSIHGATEHQNPFLGGFIEVNGQMADPPSWFGYCDGTVHTLHAQERASGRWVALDVPWLDVVGEFDNFDAMVEHILREASDE